MNKKDHEKNLNQFATNLNCAKDLDKNDPLGDYKSQFYFPNNKTNDQAALYFCGHSLGLMPKNTKTDLNEELEAWQSRAVRAHFSGQKPWMDYHENLTQAFSHLVGAKETEVVAMNGLTTNLHLALVSFYRPDKTKKRTKILIENNTFPSDRYAVLSQARFHGLDPNETIVELKPTDGKYTVDEDDLLNQIEELGDELALVMLGNCNYLSGQAFDVEKITKKAHEVGAFCGFNLAHGAGNLELNLHDHDVDFAVWCSYKYLNSGPGGIAGLFVHQKHHQDPDIPRLEGWWGTVKDQRFKMKPNFEPIPSVEAWQLSNPPIFQLAAAHSSLKIFEEAGFLTIIEKSKKINNYLQFLLDSELSDKIDIVTPSRRGTMLSFTLKNTPTSKNLESELYEHQIYLDFREPNIIRLSPVALYTSYEDVHKLVNKLIELL